MLPFANMSADEHNEFFCDGITEEIINALAQIEQLKVTSRTSSFFFKNSNVTLGEIAGQLDVATILEGSVRVGGNTLRITAQLINVEDDSHFWSETWDRPKDNIFQVQDEISLHIAEKLRETYGHLDISDHLVQAPTENFSAYSHYLKGRHHFYKWNPADANLAIEQFEKAVAIDPKLIDGQLGLADSYSFLAVSGFAPREESWQKANDAISAAKKIDRNNAGLNYLLGNQAFFTAADFKSAMDFGQKSVASKPTYPEAHRFLSFLYSLMGDLDKSREHILYAKSIDPLNHETRFFEANYLYRSGDFNGAKDILDSLLIENSQNLPALAVSSYILLKQERYVEAHALIKEIPEALIAPDERLGLLCLTDVLQGNPDPEHLSTLEKKIEDPLAHHAHSYLYIIYANMGRHDDAFLILENLFNHCSSVLLLGFSDPLAVAIRSDHRFDNYHGQIYAIDEKVVKPKKSMATQLEEDRAKIFESKLLDYIQMEQSFLNPTLSLRQLAQLIEIHPNQLSWLLNEYMGKNFNEFINGFRIEHFKKLVTDPSNNHISLIGLAYESGFNSKTVFNTTFKKTVGMTPKEFQKANS
ncbi:MAG: helix-turn-helix domain-containing protein [Cyclobacteriaceae bacterium]